MDEQLTFPVEYSIKIVLRQSGENDTGADEVLALLESHLSRVDRSDLGRRPSRRGNYTALTVPVRAETREQLEAVYEALTAHEAVLWAL